MVEYILLVALIALAVIAAVSFLGSQIKRHLQQRGQRDQQRWLVVIERLKRASTEGSHGAVRPLRRVPRRSRRAVRARGSMACEPLDHRAERRLEPAGGVGPDRAGDQRRDADARRAPRRHGRDRRSVQSGGRSRNTDRDLDLVRIAADRVAVAAQHRRACARPRRDRRRCCTRRRTARPGGASSAHRSRRS